MHSYLRHTAHRLEIGGALLSYGALLFNPWSKSHKTVVSVISSSIGVHFHTFLLGPRECASRVMDVAKTQLQCGPSHIRLPPFLQYFYRGRASVQVCVLGVLIGTSEWKNKLYITCTPPHSSLTVTTRGRNIHIKSSGTPQSPHQCVGSTHQHLSLTTHHVRDKALTTFKKHYKCKEGGERGEKTQRTAATTKNKKT